MTRPRSRSPEQGEVVRAWRRVPGTERDPGSILPLKYRPGRKRKSAVFLLTAVGPDGEDVVGKWCSSALVRFERRIYEELLPKAGVPALRVYGEASAEAEGCGWLFLQAATGKELHEGTGRHRRLVTRWLARLHTGLAGTPAPTWLQRLDGHYYLTELGSTRQELRREVRNPALDHNQLQLLHRLLIHLSRLETVWEELWDLVGHVPLTLVHGDLKPQNVRIERGQDDAVVLVFDWELAGWGIPAVDLRKVEVAAYTRQVRNFWADCSATDVEMLRRMGVLLRCVMATKWAARNLRRPWIQRPIRYLRAYESEMAAGLSELPLEYSTSGDTLP